MVPKSTLKDLSFEYKVDTILLSKNQILFKMNKTRKWTKPASVIIGTITVPLGFVGSDVTLVMSQALGLGLPGLCLNQQNPRARWLFLNYCPQRSWCNVIFSQASVILFMGGWGGSASVHAGRPSPQWQQTSPGKADPLARQTPPPLHSACWAGGIHPTVMQFLFIVIPLENKNFLISPLNWRNFLLHGGERESEQFYNG